MKTGIELIAEERRQQIENHYYTVETDVENNSKGQLIEAAWKTITGVGFSTPPENWDEKIFKRIIKKPVKERLIIAAAWIAAELDRLNYIEQENKSA